MEKIYINRYLDNGIMGFMNNIIFSKIVHRILDFQVNNNDYKMVDTLNKKTLIVIYEFELLTTNIINSINFSDILTESHMLVTLSRLYESYIEIVHLFL